MKAFLEAFATLAVQALLAPFLVTASHAQQISLQALVKPSTVIVKDGHPVTFALHGFIEFKSLSEMLSYVDSQTQRWKNNGGLDDVARQIWHANRSNRELRAELSRWSTSGL